MARFCNTHNEQWEVNDREKVAGAIQPVLCALGVRQQLPSPATSLSCTCFCSDPSAVGAALLSSLGQSWTPQRGQKGWSLTVATLSHGTLTQQAGTWG